MNAQSNAAVASPVAPVPAQETDADSIRQMLQDALQVQRESFLKGPTPDHKQRVHDLLTLKRMINENRDAIIEAINQDYGNRSRHETLFAEIITVTDGINSTITCINSRM